MYISIGKLQMFKANMNFCRLTTIVKLTQVFLPQTCEISCAYVHVIFKDR